MSDEQYKRDLMVGLHQNPEEFHKLDTIVGREEFLSFLRYAQDKPELYCGEKDDFFNSREAIFQANFHIHSTNSDGVMSVREFLDLGAKYADKFAEKNKGQKVYLALTDHDTVNGDKEALNIILENPDKYKNLGLILGVEMSSVFSSPFMEKKRDAHLLHYCVNPYDHPITDLNNERIRLLHIDVKEALQAAEIKYKYLNAPYHITYNFDEIVRMRPQLKLFPHDARLTLKDYMQFKLLFADLVTENKEVSQYLNRYGIDVNELDFTIPKFMLTRTYKRPYWLNYVDTTQAYLEKVLTEKNPNLNLTHFREIFGSVNPNFYEPFEQMEHEVLNPNSPLYIKFATKPLDFETVVREFGKRHYTVSGIAHPAYTLRGEANNPQKVQLAHDFVSRFQLYLGEKNMTIERHYPYSKDVLPQWINLFYTVADKYEHIPSGGRDSHRNNFFSRDIWLTEQQLNQITAKTLPQMNIKEMKGKGII